VILAEGLLNDLKMRPVYLPPKVDNLMLSLKTANPVAWERIQRLLDAFQMETVGEEYGKYFSSDVMKLVEGGFMKPIVSLDSDTGEADIRFVVWSYLSPEYKEIEDMEDEEFDIVDAMLEYFGRMN